MSLNMSINQFEGSRGCLGPCPEYLRLNRSVLYDPNVRKEFKQRIRMIKEEAFKRIQEMSGGIENIKQKYPFQYLLFGEYSYSFTIQRSLVTTLGQKHIPELLKFLAEKRGLKARTSYKIKMKIPQPIVNRIDEIVNSLDQGKRKPDIKRELEELVQITITLSKEPKEAPLQVVTADIYLEDPNDPKYSFYIELKTPQPKKEDCVRVKRRLLLFRIYKYMQLISAGVKLKEAFEKAIHSALIGFYYNPFKEDTQTIRRKGRYPHSFFNRICDLNEALIAEELWDCIGGLGTYTELVKIIDEVTQEFKHKT